ncbi:hypothetical protein P9112_012186 [Eukaryota sp. TZLM1-RC]
MKLEVNQQVAAFVPYTDNDHEWLVSTLVSFDDNVCTVKDEEPEAGFENENHWTIPRRHCIPLASSEEELKDLCGSALSIGDDVLALWHLDGSLWTSVFYEATLFSLCTDGKNVLVRYSGEDVVRVVPYTKLLKKPQSS